MQHYGMNRRAAPAQATFPVLSVSWARGFVLAGLLLAAGSVQAARADEGAGVATGSSAVREQRLAHRVDQLEQKVQQLETRLNALEAAGHANTKALEHIQAAPADTVQDIGTLKANWQTLSRSMKGAQVRRLLGAPTRVLKIDRNTVWYYQYKGFGNGSVMFSAQGQVVGWQIPPFGGW